jgi:hypothetical protein
MSVSALRHTAPMLGEFGELVVLDEGYSFAVI